MRRTLGRRAITALLASAAVVLVVVSDPRNSDSRCVGGRVEIKTLSDGDNVTSALFPTRIERLLRLPRPTRLEATRRSTPVEATTYRIDARLVAMRRRSDGEVDLTVSAPRRRSSTMTVGFEGSRTCGHRAVVRDEGPMKAAQQALVAACGAPTSRRTRLSGSAEIAGVGFFGDAREKGAAPNGIELHPAVQFVSRGCRRRR
jgi:hypothetical protein